jgi:hypothetical protein
MESFQENINEYRKQIQRGAVQKAYKGLMEYLMALRTHFSKKYPDHFVSGSIYYGYMDMTYFSFTPKSLLDRKLKTAVVFLHEPFRFEAWLAGNNKQIQAKYWNLIKESGWKKFSLVPTIKSVDSIIEHILVDDPDFGDLDDLTKQIEKAAVLFNKDIENFIFKY